ncbi:MAG: phage portal protein, partial [Eubacterium sp.]|nr:phage portal protein [Eubacterium sp.]
MLDFLGINSYNKRTISETTYFTCLRLLSETMGKMPLKYYRTTAQGKIRADPDRTTYALTVR